MNPEPLSPAQLEQLRSLSTCIVASAIETFGVRLRNQGFTDSRVRCVFQDLPPVVASRVPAKALDLIKGRQELVGLTRLPAFSSEQFSQKAKELRS